MTKKAYFLKIFRMAEKKYGSSAKRLAGDEWPHVWQTLIATIMSAQTRDEVTIPVAEALFKRYRSLQELACAREKDVLRIIKPVNFSPTKARNVIRTACFIIDHYKGHVPERIEELVKLPGVGRKTANLVLSECHFHDSICVDTHVHRISNVFGFVHTKTPAETEYALMKVAPRRYWRRINRIFVLWGKDVRGQDKKNLLAKLQE